MIDCMYERNGVGLAATQVGVPLRVLVIHTSQPENDDGQPIPLSTPGERQLVPMMPLTLINPEIISCSEESGVYEEGCLSIPGIYVDVERPLRMVLKSKLLDGSEIQLECGGFLARVLQHEIDHLNGIVYVQRVKSPLFEDALPVLEKIVKKSGAKNFKIKRLVS